MLLIVFKKTWVKNEGENHVMLSYGIKYLDMPCGSLHPLPPLPQSPCFQQWPRGQVCLEAEKSFCTTAGR